jgi:hypothetical protein
MSVTYHAVGITGLCTRDHSDLVVILNSPTSNKKICFCTDNDDDLLVLYLTTDFQ